jgi:hypothetical protein
MPTTASGGSLEKAGKFLQFEVGADVRVDIEERLEHRAIEAQGENLAAGAHRRRTRRAVEQLDLAEAVSGREHVQRNLDAALALLEHARAPRDDHVHRVGRRTLFDDHLAERVRRGDETAHHQRPGTVRQELEDRQFVEKVTVAHSESNLQSDFGHLQFLDPVLPLHVQHPRATQHRFLDRRFRQGAHLR